MSSVVANPTAALAEQYRVFVHREDVFASDAFTENPAVSSKCAMQLRELATVGRTHARAKATVGSNRGWRRSPLGGNGGNHFYLYWTADHPTLTAPVGQAGRAIFVRAVRHHDATSEPLRRDDFDDYEPLDFAPDFTVAALENPFTAAQENFAAALDRVRAYIGAAGGGKTQALIRAIEVGTPGDTLYLTWSTRLAEQVENHFRDAAGGTRFLPPESSVRAFDIRSWFGSILGRDIPFQTLAQSQRSFSKAVAELQLPPNKGRVWANREWDLFAEVRGHLAGGFNLEDRQGNLTSKQYLEARKEDKLGDTDAESAIAIWTMLTKKKEKEKEKEKEESVLATCFPELEAARELFDKVSSPRHLPESMRRIHRVVIDEVQDLTPLELGALMRTLSHMRDTQDRIPEIVIAGDEGQTVRPSAYKNARLKQTVKKFINQDVSTTPVETNLRCPAGVVSVLERLRQLYAGLPRATRPSGVKPTNATAGIEADLVHAALADKAEAVDLLEQLVSAGSCTCIFLADEVPDWAAATPSAPLFLTPETSKGHEYPVVLVFGVGKFIAQLNAGKLTEADLQWVRTQLDRTTVALSRTTGTLILADIDKPDGAAFLHGRELLFGTNLRPSLTAVELLAHLADREESAAERAAQHLSAAAARLEESPEAALQLLRLALFQLGRSEDVDSFTQEERLEMGLELDRRSIELLLHPSLSEPTRRRAGRFAANRFSGNRDDIAEFAQLLQVRGVSEMALQERLELLHRLSSFADSSLGQTARRRLDSRRQLLLQTLEEGSLHPSFAEQLGREADGWLGLLDAAEPGRADTLREQAAATLLTAGNGQAALATLMRVASPSAALLAAAYEAQRQWSEAAAQYLEAGDRAAAHRCYRAEGAVAQALATTDDPEATERLQQLDRGIGFLRDHFDGWLTTAERLQVTAAIAKVDHAKELSATRTETAARLVEARADAARARELLAGANSREAEHRKQADKLQRDLENLQAREARLTAALTAVTMTERRLDDDTTTLSAQATANRNEKTRLEALRATLEKQQANAERDETEMLAMLEEAEAARNALRGVELARDEALATSADLRTRLQHAEAAAARRADEVAASARRFDEAETDRQLALRSVAALRSQSVDDNNRFLREREELTAQIGALQAAAKTAAKADTAEGLAARQALAQSEILVQHWKSRADYWKANATGTTVAPATATQPAQPAPPEPQRPTPPAPSQGARLTPEDFLKGLSDSDDFFWRTDGTRVAFSLLQGLSRESSVTVWKLSANAAVKRPRFEALLQAALGYLPGWEAPLPARDTGPLADWLRAFDKLVSVQMAQHRPDRGQSDTAERAATQPSGLGTFAALLEQAKRKG